MKEYTRKIYAKRINEMLVYVGMKPYAQIAFDELNEESLINLYKSAVEIYKSKFNDYEIKVNEGSELHEKISIHCDEKLLNEKIKELLVNYSFKTIVKTSKICITIKVNKLIVKRFSINSIIKL